MLGLTLKRVPHKFNSFECWPTFLTYVKLHRIFKTYTRNYEKFFLHLNTTMCRNMKNIKGSVTSSRDAVSGLLHAQTALKPENTPDSDVSKINKIGKVQNVTLKRVCVTTVP